MSIETDRQFLADHGLRMTLDSYDGGYIVKASDGSVIATGDSYTLAVRRARAALRKRS